MKIFVTGGLGFIGRHITHFLLARGYDIIAAGTRLDPHAIDHPNFRYISADLTTAGSWQQALQEIDAVINLAGRTIFKPWTRRYKKKIYDSRIRSTGNLIESLPKDKNVTLCSASAVGYYGDRGDDPLEEAEPCGDDFLARVAVDWENEALKGEEKGVRVVTMRFGVVFGKGGGAIEKMIPPFRYFVGGPLGSGKQWLSWIHIHDLQTAVMFLLERTNIRGPVNLCSPRPVRNRDLAQILGHLLHRPSFLPAPAFMIRLILGELGSSMLCSQRCVPGVLSKEGFAFAYPDIKEAILNIVKS